MAETKTEVKTLGYMVDGEWRESKSDTWVDITNSNTGEVIARTPMCTEAEVTEAIESANRAYARWASMPIQKRTEVLFTWRPKLIESMDEIATLVSTELGKNLDEARGEVIKIIEAIDIAVGAPMLMKGESLMNVSTGHDTVSYREPLGVFAGIAPFNFPAMIPFGWMLPICIACGNTFVLKSANFVPLTSHLLLDMLYEAGLPKGVVNMVTAEKEEAEVLLKHPAIRGVSFVGSTPVGKHVYSIAAAHGKRVQAQTQAKNHGLVLADASLERTARGIINSTFGCAGMRCMALPVCVVEESIADEFVALMKKFALERSVGDATLPATELGPVVSKAHQQSVMRWIDKGDRRRRRAGARRPQRHRRPAGRAQGWPLRRPDDLRPRDRGHALRPRGGLRPDPLRQARQGLRRGHRAHEQQPVRQRLVHLHRERLPLP